MSWFTAVTGKAEDFLNRLDKSAADVLHTDDVRLNEKHHLTQDPELKHSTPLAASAGPLTPSHSVPTHLYKFGEEVGAAATFGASSVKGSLKTQIPPPTVNITPAPVSSQSSGKVIKKKNSDEALFDFLNSKDSSGNVKARPASETSRHHSRQSSTSSVVSSASKGPKSEGGGKNISEITLPPSSIKVAETSSGGVTDDGLRQDSPTNSNVSADVDVIADAMKESPIESDQSVPDSDHADVGNEQKVRQLSSLELENRLLRNEVASLNDEMATVITRAKDAESEIMRTRDKLKTQVNSASMNEHLVRELQARESDLTEALKAKDAQLAVLRVRLDEADKRVHSKERNLEEIRLERERILRDHTDSSGLHSQALDSLKEKLREVESTLLREQAAYKQLQQESGERQSRLEQEQQSMAEALTAAQKKLGDEKVKLAELTGQLRAAKSNADSARRELSEYKEKAARILQSKERLISSMKDGSSPLGDVGSVSMLEYDSLRQERDMIREELQQTKITIENLRVELQDVETQLQHESDTAQETIRSLEDTLRAEKRKKDDAELELLKQKQELQYTLEELHKQKAAFQTRINDRESEIDKLRNQLMTKSMSSSTESELESRLRSLTESLIQKQTVLEALSTEKNSLVLQLERMENQYRDLENAMPRVPSTSQLVAVNDHDDDVRQRLPMFLREVATDHEVTRRMKRAANSIDGFSIRLGVFLRRYPAARVFVIVYMVLLHLWVLVVMMTYQPEIHDSNYHPQPPDT